MSTTRTARLSLFALATAALLAPLAAAGDADALCMARRLPRAYYQARQAEMRGDLAEATRLFRAAARYPGQSKYWIAGAYSSAAHKALQRGDTTLAIRHFKTALAEQPSYYSAAQGLVGALSQAGRYHEALDGFRRIAPTLANTPHMLRTRAKLQARVRDRAGLRETLELLRARGDLRPSDLELLRGSGGIKFQGPGALGRL